MYKLGIDLGGTKIEGVILDSSNVQLFRERIATERERGYDQILHNLEELYQRMSAKIDGQAHTLGIGTPGALSPKTGLLRNSNTTCMNGMPVQQDLEGLLGRSLRIQNDANCFAMAEAYMGAAAGKDLVFGIIMGTGCGGGIVYKQKVLTGQHAIAGEWGHTSIDSRGPACWCGSHGCVETLISGGGLVNLYKEKFDVKIDFEQVVAGYRNGVERDVAFMNVFLANFGRALANLINTLDPDIVVLGGGLSNIEELYTIGVERVRSMVFSDFLDTPIVQNKLGDSAGVIGAALVGC